MYYCGEKLNAGHSWVKRNEKKKNKKALIFQDVYCVMTKHIGYLGIQTNQNNTEIKIAAF